MLRPGLALPMLLQLWLCLWKSKEKKSGLMAVQALWGTTKLVIGLRAQQAVG